MFPVIFHDLVLQQCCIAMIHLNCYQITRHKVTVINRKILTYSDDVDVIVRTALAYVSFGSPDAHCRVPLLRTRVREDPALRGESH